MWWTERVAHWHRRVDVRLGSTLAMIFAPLVAVVLFALYCFVADEMLELATAELDERLTQLEAAMRDPDAAQRDARLELLTEQLRVDSGGYLARGKTGRVLARSPGFVAAEGDPARRQELFAAIRLTDADLLRAARSLPTGVRLEVSIAAGRFVRERSEIAHGFWASLALGVGLVMLASLPATRRALRPLRRATRAVEAVDVERLDARLPHRDTRDDVDRHADAVNRLFDRLELGFDRIQSFSHDVAHELRTPVNRILNVAEIALLEAGASNGHGAELETIRSSAEHVARLIDGLLLLARSEQGCLSLELVHIDVAELCRTLAEMYEPACDDLGIRLELGAIDGAVIADSSLLLRAVGNLIDNALAHTPPGGVLRLSAHRAAGADSPVVLEVWDSGRGIPQADRQRIFGRFVRLDAARGADGSGLGLAIARTVMRAQGGDVELVDSGGLGARFAVRIPAADGDFERRPQRGNRSACGAI
jgi:two-component system, OmpR family, heavy metal sensor histidine kinase CusS